MGTNDMGHMDYLEAVAAADVEHLRKKEETYTGSWKRRGGVGAFLMSGGETPTEYKELYCWEGGKWLMLDAYRHCWGKEP